MPTGNKLKRKVEFTEFTLNLRPSKNLASYINDH